MRKWQRACPTVFDIMSNAENGDDINIARRLCRQGIDKANEWSYYYDCFMWPLLCEEKNKEKCLYQQVGHSFILSNERTLCKIVGLFSNHYNANVEGKQSSKYLEQWTKLEEQCKAAMRKPLIREDSVIIKSLIAQPWEWHIKYVLEYLGHELEPKEEQDPFDPTRRVSIASPRETTNYFAKEFFTKEHKQKYLSTVGGKKFSTMSLWLALKMIGVESAKNRNLCLYTYTWEDGSEQSYLKITADGNTAYVCTSIKENN